MLTCLHVRAGQLSAVQYLSVRNCNWQTKRCWYMPRKLGAYWKWFGTVSMFFGMFSVTRTFSITL